MCPDKPGDPPKNIPPELDPCDGCRCCMPYYYNCIEKNCPGGPSKETPECVNMCVSDMCFAKDSPALCHTGQKCANQMCPDKPGDPPKMGPSPTPTPTPPPPTPKPITDQWRLRFHQEMEYEWSALWWTLIDSNGDEAGKGQGKPIDSQRDFNKLPHKLLVDVDEATDKYRTNVLFTYDKEFNTGHCKYKWTLGQSKPKGAAPRAMPCKEGPQKDFGCDDPKKIEWKGKNAGFERYFECWFVAPQWGDSADSS